MHPRTYAHIQGFVNGSVGIVEEFDEITGAPVVRFSNGTRKIEVHEWTVENDRREVIARRHQVGESAERACACAQDNKYTYART